jgi:hypothetical protein
MSSLELLAKVGFWSMPTIEHTGQKTDAAGRKRYVVDGSFWMVEGCMKVRSIMYIVQIQGRIPPRKLGVT